MNNQEAFKEWGLWSLSEDTLNSFDNENVGQTKDEFDKKYLFLFEKIKLKENDEMCEEIPLVADSLLSDYLPFDSFQSIKTELNPVCSNEESIVNDLVKQVIDNIHGNAENVQEIIEMVSNNKNEDLIVVLSKVWSQIHTEHERIKFIKLISACVLSLHLFCKEILLTKLKEEKGFHDFMEIIDSVAQWLGSSLVVDTLLPLLKEMSSPLVNEQLYLKRCIDSFSNAQKNVILSGYIDMVDGRLQNHDLQVLTTLLESIPLSNNSFAKLVDLFSKSITDYCEDRNFGKIILLSTENMTSDISKNVLNDFSLVCNNYKGVMRYRIKAALKKKIDN